MNTAQLKCLPLEADMFGTKSTINPVLIWDNEGATLIDSGYPGLFPDLRKAVEEAGVPFGQVRRVIITHQDWDHIGILPDILSAGKGQIEIIAHVEEKPYIDGSLPLIKLTPERIAARLQLMPEEMRPKAARFFANLPTAPVHRTVEDQEILPFHGGIAVIHTPGHTPGHICLYVKSHRLLIAGDQLRVVDGALTGPAPEHTFDMPTALHSLKKLAGYDIDSVVCFHGGLFSTNVNKTITGLAGA